MYHKTIELLICPKSASRPQAKFVVAFWLENKRMRLDFKDANQAVKKVQVKLAEGWTFLQEFDRREFERMGGGL